MASVYKTPEEAELAWRGAVQGILLGMKACLEAIDKNEDPEEQYEKFSATLKALIQTLIMLVNEGPGSYKEVMGDIPSA